jgi:glycosyltransferase involved in cell wall biosynthesis
MSPRVSVVTTVYNGEPFFDRAIPGILGQTYTDFEWIIVDDGSTDRTAELLQELARREPRVRVHSPGRLGLTAAANYGITKATGELIARQDFDDRSYPERLGLQVAFLDAHPHVGVVGGYYILIDERRGERYLRMLPTEHQQILPAMAKYIPMANTVVTFRRKVWADAGGYPDVADHEDLRLWVQVAKLGWRLANLDQPIGEHYVHDGSFFHRSFRYIDRQRNLARLQARIVRELGLPKWMYLFPAGRYAYAYFPRWLKRAVRRQIGGGERDI